MESLAHFFGTDRVRLAVDSTVTGTTRLYKRLSLASNDVTGARIYAGLHLRNSMNDGARLGRQVADWILRDNFREFVVNELARPKGGSKPLARRGAAKLRRSPEHDRSLPELYLETTTQPQAESKSFPIWRCDMPLINVKLIEEVFSPQQKREIIEKVTDAMVSIEGENMRGVTWVIVEDVRSGDWGIGGQGLTTQDVRALAEGAPAPNRPFCSATRVRLPPPGAGPAAFPIDLLE